MSLLDRIDLSVYWVTGGKSGERREDPAAPVTKEDMESLLSAHQGIFKDIIVTSGAQWKMQRMLVTTIELARKLLPEIDIKGASDKHVLYVQLQELPHSTMASPGSERSTGQHNEEDQIPTIELVFDMQDRALIAKRFSF